MNSKKTRNPKSTTSRVRPSPKFAPQFMTLEDRTTPATFYVDQAFVGKNNGDVVTFNNGFPGQKAGLVFGTDAFATFNAAIAKANGAAGDDTIRIANGTYSVDNATGPVVVTDTVSIFGSGNGATLLTPTTDAGLNNGGLYTGSNSALIRISTAGKSLNVSDINLDGGGGSIFSVGNPGGVGSFLRYENGSKGAISLVNNVYDYVHDGVDATNEGAGIVATGAGTTVTVSNSTFTQYGYVGVAYQLGATGTVSGSTFTGSGAFQITEYGVTVSEGSNVTISGNVFSGHTGSITVGGSKATGAGIFVTSYNPTTDTFDTATSAKIFGNNISGNITGIIVGQANTVGNLDTKVTALIRHNNITGNQLAIDSSVVATTTVDALLNWWGNPTGPFAAGNTTPAGNNPTSTGNPVDTRVLWRDVTISPNSGILATATPINITATSDADYRSQLPKAGVTITAVSVSPTNVSPVAFKIQFTEAVSAFDLTDVTVTSAVGGTNTLLDSASNPVTATTRDSIYFVRVTGPTGSGNITVNVPVSGVGLDGLPTVRTDLFGGTAAAGTPVTILFDNVAPTISLSSPNGTLPITATASPTGFIVTFNEAVTGFTASDLVLSGKGAQGVVPTVTKADSLGLVYNVSLANLSKPGPINVAIAAGAAIDLAGNNSAAFASSQVINFAPPFSRGFAAGGDVGSSQPYFGVDETFATQTGIFPFESDFTGGVRVASIDLNGDGTLDIIVGSGIGRRAEIRVYDGLTTKLLGATQVFESTFNLGVFVSAGDINGDGVPDIVVTPDAGGSARVTIFDGKTFLSTNGATPVTISNFFAFPDDSGYRGGARSAVGDINADGKNDLVIGAGTGGGPRVATFNGATLGSGGGPRLFNDYFAFSPSDAETLRNGVFVAVGDINGDGFADIVTGSGDGGGPRVQTYSGKALLTNVKTRITDFFAQTVQNDQNNRGGSRVAVKDLDGDSKLDIVVSPGRLGNAKIGVFFGSNPNLLPPGGVLASDKTVDLFGNFKDGLFVG